MSAASFCLHKFGKNKQYRLAVSKSILMHLTDFLIFNSLIRWLIGEIGYKKRAPIGALNKLKIRLCNIF